MRGMTKIAAQSKVKYGRDIYLGVYENESNMTTSMPCYFYNEDGQAETGTARWKTCMSSTGATSRRVA